jgi:hypothetical protein
MFFLFGMIAKVLTNRAGRGRPWFRCRLLYLRDRGSPAPGTFINLFEQQLLTSYGILIRALCNPCLPHHHPWPGHHQSKLAEIFVAALYSLVLSYPVATSHAGRAITVAALGLRYG